MMRPRIAFSPGDPNGIGPEIAARLHLAEGTVKNHVSAILEKLHAANRTQAARVAREQGLI